jgi:hypothetical protein
MKTLPPWRVMISYLQVKITHEKSSAPQFFPGKKVIA